MDVGVGIFSRVAKPHDVDACSQHGGGHPSMGIKVVLVPPTVAVIEHHVDVNASIVSVDEGFNQVDLVKQIHVNV